MSLMGVWKAKQAACAACLLACLVQEVGAKLSPDILLAVANYHEAWHCWLAINAALSILQLLKAARVHDLLDSWRDIACLAAASEEHVAILGVGDKLQRRVL